MTTEFENELRDMFREKAAEAPLATPTMPASAPREVLRRGRLHQVGTVLGSMVVVIALIVGSVAGLTRILGEGVDDRDIGDGGYEVFQRTATVEAFTVGSPSDWFLVNAWPLSMQIAVEGSSGSSSKCVAVPGGEPVECEDTPGVETSSPISVPHGLPMLQLSNVDLGLTANACEAGLPGGAAALYVALDYDAAIGGISDPSIQEFPPGIGLPPEGDGPCGLGRYAYFTVNGERFFSWIGVGSGASDEDREIVETSFEMMSAIPDWEPSPLDETTPAYVIAGGGTEAGVDWRLELRPSGSNVEISLFGTEPGGSAARFTVPDVPIESCCEYEVGFTEVAFGAIRKGATGVELRSTDGDQPIPGTILPIPPTMSFEFDLFFIPGTGGLTGEVVPLGIDGADEPSVSPPPGPEADIVELSGPYGQHTWIVGFTGSLADGTACIRVNVDRADLAPHCSLRLSDTLASDQPLLHAWLTDDFYLRAGVVPANVHDITFRSDDGTDAQRELQCTTAPVGWSDPARRVCVIALPPEGAGTYEYLDADGAILFQEGMRWGAAEPEAPTPIDPVHGGTYWAVYPWVGAAESPDAQNVSAQLLEDFGIEAFPGDLSCDDGAAEALGTDAEQGIGVYFETQDDANESPCRPDCSITPGV